MVSYTLKHWPFKILKMRIEMNGNESELAMGGALTWQS